MKEIGKLVTKLRAHIIQELRADRILKTVIHLTVATKLARAAKLEVPAACTGRAIIIINEGESTLAYNTQTKNRAIAAELAISNTKEGHPTNCRINTTIKCHERLAKVNQSP